MSVTPSASAKPDSGASCREATTVPTANGASPNPRHDESGFECLCGIPLWVEIPEGDELCPYLGERKGSFYRLIKQGVLIRRITKGLKEGTPTVFGPSVCDAKVGCRCGRRRMLEILRAEDAQPESATNAGGEAASV